MPSCFVPNCTNGTHKFRKKTGITFHRFPKTATKEWLRAIGKSPTYFITHERICSDHFKEEDFENFGVQRRLKPDAVPSLNIPIYIEGLTVVVSSSSDTELENVPPNQHDLTSHHSLELEGSNANEVTSSAASSSNVIGNVEYFNRDKNSEISDSTCEDIEEESISEAEISEADYNCEPNPTISLDEATTTSQVTLKRKLEPKRMKSKGFQGNPRYIGDLRREDFTSGHAWQVVQDYVQERRTKTRTLNQKVNRLTRKVENYKKLLALLKKTGFISMEASDAAAVDL